MREIPFDPYVLSIFRQDMLSAYHNSCLMDNYGFMNYFLIEKEILLDWEGRG